MTIAYLMWHGVMMYRDGIYEFFYCGKNTYCLVNRKEIRRIWGG